MTKTQIFIIITQIICSCANAEFKKNPMDAKDWARMVLQVFARAEKDVEEILGNK